MDSWLYCQLKAKNHSIYIFFFLHYRLTYWSSCCSPSPSNYNHRAIDWVRLAETSRHHPLQSPKSDRVPESCPSSFWLSTGKETSPPLFQGSPSDCPDVQRETPVLQSATIASYSVAEHHWKEPDCVSFAPSLQVFIYLNNPKPTFLQAAQSLSVYQ